jgi:hypothetical protein
MRPLPTAYDPDLVVCGRAFAGERYHGGGVEGSRQDHFVAFFHQGIQALHERSGINRVALKNMTSRSFPGALARGTRVDRLLRLLGPDIAQANLLGGALWSSHSERCRGDERRAGQPGPAPLGAHFDRAPQCSCELIRYPLSDFTA